jgi:hypothetical protein
MPISDRLEFCEDGFAGNEVEFFFDADGLNINIENPYAGSTDTGFGYTCNISIPIEKAREIAEWLLQRCK